MCSCSKQSKSLGQVSWCDREILSAVRLMHERELFGGLGGACGGELGRRAGHACRERVRSVDGAVLGGRRGRGADRVPFVPFGRLSWSACMTERSARAKGEGRIGLRSYPSGPVTR